MCGKLGQCTCMYVLFLHALSPTVRHVCVFCCDMIGWNMCPLLLHICICISEQGCNMRAVAMVHAFRLITQMSVRHIAGMVSAHITHRQRQHICMCCFCMRCLQLSGMCVYFVATLSDKTCVTCYLQLALKRHIQVWQPSLCQGSV